MSKKLLTIWFDSNGDMLVRYYGTGYHGVVCKSEEGKDFQDEMIYDHIYNGAVSRVYFKSATTGRKYNMFLDQFDLAIKDNQFNDNRLKGTFRFEKRGQAQAIKLVLEKPKSP